MNLHARQLDYLQTISFPFPSVRSLVIVNGHVQPYLLKVLLKFAE